MAVRTFCAWVVLIRVDAFEFRPLTGGVRKIGVTPQAEVSAPVVGEFRWICGMLARRSMAVFALYDLMGGRKDLFFLFGMTVLTVLLPLIFYLNGLPFLYIARPIPAEHVPPFMDAKILGYHEDPGGQDQGGHNQNHKKGS
jgi:hypothetical protein